MMSGLDVLAVLASVTISFVAFATVIATLKRTLGRRLNQLQRLLVRWFTETGMLVVSIELLPLVLASFWQDEVAVARYSIIYALITTVAYLIYYGRQRFIVDAPKPVASWFVVAGYVIWLPILAMASVGVVFQPSLAIIVAYSFWAFLGAAIIFIAFLATFIFDEEPSS